MALLRCRLPISLGRWQHHTLPNFMIVGECGYSRHAWEVGILIPLRHAD